MSREAAVGFLKFYILFVEQVEQSYIPKQVLIYQNVGVNGFGHVFFNAARIQGRNSLRWNGASTERRFVDTDISLRMKFGDAFVVVKCE